VPVMEGRMPWVWEENAQLDQRVFGAMSIMILVVLTCLNLKGDLFLNWPVQRIIYALPQPTVCGVSGVGGVAVLPHVEEEHKLQQEELNKKQQVEVSSARVLRQGPKNVGWKTAQLTVCGVSGVAGVAVLPHVEEEHKLQQEALNKKQQVEVNSARVLRQGPKIVG